LRSSRLDIRQIREAGAITDDVTEEGVGAEVRAEVGEESGEPKRLVGAIKEMWQRSHLHKPRVIC